MSFIRFICALIALVAFLLVVIGVGFGPLDALKLVALGLFVLTLALIVDWWPVIPPRARE